MICEGSARVGGVSDGARFVQHKPHFHDEPVLTGDSFVDAYGCSIYGSVLREAGGFRMWYQAWPRDFDGTDSLLVGCVESDDGIHWRRPEYGLIERGGSRDNHLTSLPFHAPSVCIDPHADSDRRYRAFGYLRPDRAVGFDVADGEPGYYTAHSDDGLCWQVEPGPLWHGADVITAAWDPSHGAGGAVRVALKRNGPAAGQYRRRFFTGEWSDGRATSPVSAFVPDESDDLVARAHGCVSADYYGLSWLPTPGPTVAVVWTFRHVHPLGRSADRLWNYGSLGQVDLELRYQTETGGRWLALPGRPDWVAAASGPEWARGCLYGASHAIEVGDVAPEPSARVSGNAAGARGSAGGTGLCRRTRGTASQCFNGGTRSCAGCPAGRAVSGHRRTRRRRLRWACRRPPVGMHHVEWLNPDARGAEWPDRPRRTRGCLALGVLIRRFGWPTTRPSIMLLVYPILRRQEVRRRVVLDGSRCHLLWKQEGI